jgi:hypothetical protein
MATGIFDSRAFFTRRSSESAPTAYFRDANEWCPKSFAREQVRGLVRQVFFSSVIRQVRQVIFTAVESGTDVGSICQQVGRALALETQARVAVVCNSREDLDSPTGGEPTDSGRIRRPGARLHELAVKAADNLWFVSRDCFSNQADAVSQGSSDRHGCLPLPELRSEFDYSIVPAPPAGESTEAAALGQIADGVILVVAADQTRRVAARKTIDTLRAAQVQLLGTVLSDRTFPIPEGIYRRL